MPQREGSPWQGLGAVFLKETSDNFTSARMRVLEWLVILTACAALYAALQDIRATTAEDPFLFLRLFTKSRDPLPSFVSLLGFLVPLISIGLGFDAINGERNRYLPLARCFRPGSEVVVDQETAATIAEAVVTVTQ